MEASATLRNVSVAPRKVRSMVDIIRGRRVNDALHVLTFQASPNARRVKKLLFSVVANWESKYPDVSLEKVHLYIKAVAVDAGRSLKRIRPAPHGRAHRIKKRSCHVRVVVGVLEKDATET